MALKVNDEHLLINTEVHRQKFKNVERDPRVTLTIWAREDPYRFVEARGEVVGITRGPEAREHIDELSHKYHGRPYRTKIRSERVILRIAPLPASDPHTLLAEGLETAMSTGRCDRAFLAD